MDEDEYRDYLESRRAHPVFYQTFHIPVPKTSCPRCGDLFAHLERPWWREDGPKQCSGCSWAEQRGDISNPGTGAHRRKEHMREIAARPRVRLLDQPEVAR